MCTKSGLLFLYESKVRKPAPSVYVSVAPTAPKLSENALENTNRHLVLRPGCCFGWRRVAHVDRGSPQALLLHRVRNLNPSILHLLVHVPAYPPLQAHLVLLSEVLLLLRLRLLRLHLHVFVAQVLELLEPLLLPGLLVELVEVDAAEVELHEVLQVLLGEPGSGGIGGVGGGDGVVVWLPRRVGTARVGSTGLVLGVSLIH